MIINALSGFFDEDSMIIVDLDWSLPQGQADIPVTLEYVSE